MKIKVDGSAGIICNAIYVTGSMTDFVVMNSLVESVGVTSGTVMTEDSATLPILSSKISASSTNPPLGAGNAAAIRVAGSHLTGGAVFTDGGATITCAGVYDESYSFSVSTCP